jgi:hypothetical protein
MGIDEILPVFQFVYFHPNSHPNWNTGHIELLMFSVLNPPIGSKNEKLMLVSADFETTVQ